MKRFSTPRTLKVLVSIVLVAVVAACGTRDESAADAQSEKVLHVYNWADYIGESTIREFETRTGIKVVYDVYDASEVLQTKLLTGQSGYDVVVTRQSTEHSTSASRPAPNISPVASAASVTPSVKDNNNPPGGMITFCSSSMRSGNRPSN